jgi:hypothetical protein
MTTKSFYTGDILSITTGYLLTREPGLGAVYEILNHLTGDSLMTHQIPLAADAMTPELHQQLPWTRDLTPAAGDTETLLAWRDQAIADHGEYHNLEPAPLAWGSHDPIRDLHNVAPHMKVIGVVAPGPDSP